MKRNLTLVVVAVLVVVALCLPVVRPRQQQARSFLGKGVWIYGLSDTERGNIKAIASKAEWAGLDHVLVKTHDGGDWWKNDRRRLLVLIDELHKRKILVLAWGYVYGRRGDAEARQAIASLKMPFDGYVFDAEAEYSGKPETADRTAAKVEAYRDANSPEKILGYSSFSKTFNHPNVPYLELGRHTDFAMPQDYWAVFGTQPAETLAQMCTRWGKMEEGWRKAGYADSVKPIIPTGQIVDHHDHHVPVSELAEFLRAGRGYFGINVWRWDLMTRAQWNVLHEFEPEKRPVQVLPAKRRPLRVAWWLKIWLLGAVVVFLVGMVAWIRKRSIHRPLPARTVVSCLCWPIYVAAFASIYSYVLYREFRRR